MASGEIDAAGFRRAQSMIPKSGSRFSDKIMLKRKIKTMIQLN
jgi:hypothetical protein